MAILITFSLKKLAQKYYVVLEKQTGIGNPDK